MVKEIVTLAGLFDSLSSTLEDNETQIKTAAKSKMSRKQMLKNLEKAKVKHKQLKDKLDTLEVDDEKRRADLDKTRTDLNETRSNILSMHKALQGMDLANSNDAVFYDNDVAYLINGKEFHLEMGDDNAVKLVPMNKHRKDQKAKKNPEVNCTDDNCSDDSHDHSEAKEDLEGEDLLEYLDASMED